MRTTQFLLIPLLVLPLASVTSVRSEPPRPPVEELGEFARLPPLESSPPVAKPWPPGPPVLAAQIDAALAAAAGGELAPESSDNEFVRRVYLDLLGRIPTAAEARSFVADTSPDKRLRLIDTLLVHAERPPWQATQLDIALMERREPHPLWLEYLRDRAAANVPWDQLARELVNPRDAELPGAAHFLSKRLENYGQNPVDIPGLVRDVGRMLLGVDVQCAQCHDHLFVDEYKQRDFQGLLAFVGNLSRGQDPKTPEVVEAPRLETLEFVSVFGGDKQRVGPRLPLGREFEIPAMAKGEEYLVAPDRQAKTPGVLRFSTLKLLADELPSADNPLFVRNIVNRVWAQVFGRGLIEPLDLAHRDNPPSHPELLDALCAAFVEQGMDLRWLTRELMATEAYQRSSQLPGLDVESLDRLPPTCYRVALERPLAPEQLLSSLLVATGEWRPAVGASQQSPGESELATTFRAALAAQLGEPEVGHRPSVRAALLLMHGAPVQRWLRPEQDNLMSQLTSLDDPDAAIDELYWSVLSRPADDGERAAAAAYLGERPDEREAALGNLLWSLLASNEFLLNH